MGISSALHVVDESFISMVVLSATAATAIVTGVVLSICWLKEKFVWQYDLAAIFCMTVGCVLMIIQCNK